MALSNGPNIDALVAGLPGEEHFNELMRQWRILDVLVQGHVKAIQNAPAGGPADGDAYIVLVGTGAWAAHDHSIARWSTVEAAWEFSVPKKGWRVHNEADSSDYRFNGATWVDVEAGSVIDTDATMGAYSDLVVPSQKAVVDYVAEKLDGRAWKQPVRAATTAAQTLATDFENGDTIDGVVLATGDRVLIKNQAAGAANGIYVVNVAGAPTRAHDADAAAELVNATVEVSEGTTNHDTQWTCSTNAPIVVNTTALVFVATGSATSYTADETTLHQVANQFQIKALGVGSGEIAANAVTNAKLAQMATATIKARKTAGTGDAEDITPTELIVLFPANGIANAKLGAMANATVKGRTTAGVGDPEDLTMTQLAALLQSAIKPTECIPIAVGDETTAHSTGVAKVTFRMPYAFTLTEIRGSLTTAPTGGTLFAFDVKEAGVTLFSTKPTFDAASTTTVGAATPAVISDTSLADNAVMTINIDAIGSTIAGAGLKVYLIGHRT